MQEKVLTIVVLHHVDKELDQRGERVRRKKRQVREKVGKSRFTAFFQ